MASANEAELRAAEKASHERYLDVKRECDELTIRLQQRSEALSRVIEEKDAYRKALVAVLELEPTDLGVGGGTAILTRDEVHDAIGSDLIMALMYRQRAVQFLPAIEETARIAEEITSHPERAEWREPEPTTLADVAEALERMRRMRPSFEAARQARLAGKLAPFTEDDLAPYLEAHDRAVKEIIAEQLAEDDEASSAVRIADGAIAFFPDGSVEPVPAAFYSKGGGICVCTVQLLEGDERRIYDREATCPFHGGARCPACGSGHVGTRNCKACSKRYCEMRDECDNRWHDA